MNTTPTSATDERVAPTAHDLPPPPVPNGSPGISLPAAPTRQLEPLARPAAPRAPGASRRSTGPPRFLIGGMAGLLAVALLLTVSQGRPVERARIESFSGRGISFSYPSTLQRLAPGDADEVDVAQMTHAAADGDDAAWREVFVMDESDVVVVFGRDLPYLVDDENVRAYEASVLGRYRAAGIELPRTRVVAVDGLVALSSASYGRTPAGAQVEIRTTEIFTGSTGYVVICQRATEGSAELVAACDAILRSVEIEARGRTAGWHTLASRAGRIRLPVPPGWQAAESVRRGTAVAASLPAATEGTTAARVAVTTVKLRRPVPTAVYVDAVADRMKRYLVGRTTLRIDGRPAEMLRFEDNDAAGVFYVFVEGRTAFAVRFDIPIGNRSFTLLRPTMDGIVGMLRVR